MSGQVNRVILIGALDVKPSVVNNPGALSALFILCTESEWKDKGGEVRKSKQWHRVVVTDERMAEVAGQLQKDERIYVEGMLRTRKITTKAGTEHWLAEITVEPFRGKIVPLKGGPRMGASSREGARPDYLGETAL